MSETIKYLIGGSNAAGFIVACGFAFLLVCAGLSTLWRTVKNQWTAWR